MIRFGLCCIFREAPIRFRRTTAKHLKTLAPGARREKLAEIALHNAASLEAALRFCHGAGILDFRINSQILPLKTHPEVGYDITDLPGWEAIVAAYEHCGRFCRQNRMRTTFHPDQFIVLSSPSADVVKRSVAELSYQAEVAEWVNADVINLHAGGAYGDKPAALERLAGVISKLPAAVRSRLTLENDDRVYTPEDLLPLCRGSGIPLVYDAHHHRCLPDRYSIEAATQKVLETWDREPLFHISSPLGGWDAPEPRKHADFLNPSDFPDCWRHLDITVEIEAKAKELAVADAIKQFGKRPAKKKNPQSRKKQ